MEVFHAGSNLEGGAGLSRRFERSLAVQAKSGKKDRHDGHDRERKVLKVALWGDEFYSDDPLAKDDTIDQSIESMNDRHMDFTLFASDTKNGSSPCTDQAIGYDVIDIFNRLKAPTLYTLGDNEWTDCHPRSHGKRAARVEQRRTADSRG